MLNLQQFAVDFYKQVVTTCGSEILQQAETNPPQPRTPGFSKVVDVVLLFIKAKSNKQELVIRLISAQPQFATTMVMEAIIKAMDQKDHKLTIDMLGDFPKMLAEYCADLILGDPTPAGKMTPEQVGAAHNLLNLTNLLYPDDDQAFHTIGHLRSTMLFRFQEVDTKFLERSEWAVGYLPRRDAKKATTGRVDTRKMPQVQTQRRLAPTNRETPSSTPNNGKPVLTGASVQKQKRTPFASKLADALRPATVASAPEESADVQEQLMKAELNRLGGLHPEAIDRAKFGVEPPPAMDLALSADASESKVPQTTNGFAHSAPLVSQPEPQLKATIQ